MPPLWIPPTDEAVMWFDPSQASSVTLDPLVTNIVDLSGNGRDGTNAGSGKPTYSTGVFNGLNALSLAGEQYLTITSGVVCATQMTLFSIFRRATSGTTSAPLGAFVAGAGLSPMYWISNNSAYAHYGSTPVTLSASALSGDFIVTTIINGVEFTVRRNGALWGYRADAGTRGLPMNSVGRLNSYSHNGLIGEMLASDMLVDYEKYEGYLAHKWGVTLDASHPYFASPPYDPFWCNFKGQTEI